MSYESVSAIVVLAIVVVVAIGWLPRRTLDGMNKVIEHREDRYSPSLHLIDASDGTRFSHERASALKGSLMQATQTQGHRPSQEHIAQIRKCRHEAVHRRQIIVVSLLVLTAVVVVAAFLLKFSPFYALIPLCLVFVVLGLGINASRQAREWESKVAVLPNTHQAARVSDEPGERSARRPDPKPTLVQGRRQTAAETRAQIGQKPMAEPKRDEGSTASAQGRQPALTSREMVASDILAADAATDVMEQREIRRALKQSRNDTARAAAEREQRGQEHAATQRAHDAGTVSAGEVDDKGAGVMEVGAQQDLISFSLGAPPAGVDSRPQRREPESREIKSTRQVVKAVPVEQVESQEDASKTVADAKAFHKAEVESQVEAPAATADSLGADLEAILARRAA